MIYFPDCFCMRAYTQGDDWSFGAADQPGHSRKSSLPPGSPFGPDVPGAEAPAASAGGADPFADFLSEMKPQSQVPKMGKADVYGGATPAKAEAPAASTNPFDF